MKDLHLILCALLVATLSYARPSAADQLTLSPELKAAVGLWLADDDERALPALSELANAGDRSAQLFLALVERTRLGPTDYVTALSRDALLDTFRPPKPESRFRPSWIDKLANDGDAFALTLRQSFLPDPNPGAIKSLLDAGEVNAAKIGIRYLSLYGTTDDRETLLNAPYSLYGLRPFVLAQHVDGKDKTQGLEIVREMARFGSGRTVGNDDSYARDLAIYLNYGYPFGAATRDNPWRDDIAAWMAKSDASQPITSFCRKHCDDEVTNCGVSVLGLIGGYQVAIRFASPLEGVLSSRDYADSARAHGTILRRIASLESEQGDGYLASLDEIAEQSQCIATLVAPLRAKAAHQ